MLRLVLGRSGSGKTRFTLDKATQLMQAGQKTVIVVPEQFTFATERSLLRAIGPECCLYTEVLSFSRMVHRVLSEYGGNACRYIDDCGRYIIMHRAIAQVLDRLNIYRRQAVYPAFAKLMVDTAVEYKLCGVTPDLLDETIRKTEEAVLKQKLGDISLILRAYDAILGNSIKDTADNLTRLCEKLRQHNYFKGKTVIIDSFKGFTSQEKAVIRELLMQADDVYVTLCADQLKDEEQGYGLFSPVRKTAQSLVLLANRSGIPVASPVVLEPVRRFKNRPLEVLEVRIFRTEAVVYDQPAREIHIVSASNIYDEAQFAAQETARLMREEGVRARDIVILSRGLEQYKGILDPAFKKYDIPLFFDTRRSVETHPLMTLTLCSLEIILSNFRFEAVFRYLKTGLAGFDTVDISMLENYVLTWDLKGREQWQNEWKGNPDGFAGEITSEGERQLTTLNDLRQRFVAPVLGLAQVLEGSPDARAMVAALYDYLIALGADQTVEDIKEQLISVGEAELADEYSQIWDKLIHIFDQSAAVLAQEKLTIREMYELLHLAIANSELAHIPPSLDEVTAGDAERIRAGDARYAFVIGLADGIFPRGQTAGGVITDAEREKLIGLGLELTPPARQRIVEEQFIAYKAFTCASEGLYLLTPRCDTTGRVLRESHFLLAARALFPRCDQREEALDTPLDAIANKKSAFEQLALSYHTQTPLRSTLMRYFSGLEEYGPRLNSLKAASVKKMAAFEQPALARALYGERMHISPSRLENFEQCRFLYFCRYGLRARTRRKAGLMAPEIGTLIHFVLERLLASQKGKRLAELPKQELDETVDRLLGEFADVYLGGLEAKPERFKYLFFRLRETVIVLVEHIGEELANSDFTPVDFELAIRADGEVKPVVLELPDGGSIAVEGTVDRVDLMQKNGVTYLRVIDYKTGAKSFNLPDVVYGLNLQMFIYLFSLCDNAKERYTTAQIMPAGVLYLPAKRPEVTATRGDTDEKIKGDVQSGLRMSGLVLGEPEIIAGMEHNARGVFIPAKLKANAGEGPEAVDLRSSVASMEQFGILKRHIEKILRQMAATLRSGDVAALPVEGLNYHPCEYCEFISVCGHEKGDRVRVLRKTEHVWDDLKGGDKGG